MKKVKSQLKLSQTKILLFIFSLMPEVCPSFKNQWKSSKRNLFSLIEEETCKDGSGLSMIGIREKTYVQ